MKLPTIKFKIPKIKIYGIDVVKNSLFFFFYIILSLLIIAFILAPSVKLFKKAKAQYFQAQSQFDKTKEEYQTLLKEVEKLKTTNKRIINALNREFNPDNFKLFARDFMQIHSIKKEKTSPYKDKFIYTTYLISATIKSPKNFYDFIDAAKNYKNIIRVYFPFNFVKNKNDINLTFRIDVYNLKKRLYAQEKAH